ncbi:hypothetical protein Nepgr_010872 [Nepenthes gracilis]|uniref:Uncharacterized protein n=1 Tax=Nepenthes gracilis TaxID=150966 RepID=A0AAD3SE87_NEPGR|nr:hypothetical protein Nepgr_010869 [Nepenthes gracilis]GMH09032.1 hypothetical protein Nepgr_010872 [Nepenthes gracilis]
MSFPPFKDSEFSYMARTQLNSIHRHSTFSLLKTLIPPSVPIPIPTQHGRFLRDLSPVPTAFWQFMVAGSVAGCVEARSCVPSGYYQNPDTGPRVLPHSIRRISQRPTVHP